MSSIKIEIPDKGSFYLTHKDFQDEIVGDTEAIEHYLSLFKNAIKNKLTYTWYDHTASFTEEIIDEHLFNCDAIKAVLEYNKITVPIDFPSNSEWFRKCAEIDEIEVII